MSNGTVYNMKLLSDCVLGDIDCFIVGLHNDDRSVESINKIGSMVTIKNVIAIEYDKNHCSFSTDSYVEHVSLISACNNPIEFISKFKCEIQQYIGKKIIVDISCIRVPELFSILKILQMNDHSESILFTYSVPYDYEYHSGNFVYRASIGDLENYELIGYGGEYDASATDSTYVVFLGFEGALSLKVLEEAEYKNLNFVNGLPSLYQKYKDISILNNSSVIKGNNYKKMLYTPADNPFETYNMLERNFSSCSSLCISPLGTKATSLGVCLFALIHNTTRIVFPISANYSSHLSNKVVKTWVYEINIPKREIT